MGSFDVSPMASRDSASNHPSNYPVANFSTQGLTRIPKRAREDPEPLRRHRYSMRFDCSKTLLVARLVLRAVLGYFLSSEAALALAPKKALSQYWVYVWKQK